MTSDQKLQIIHQIIEATVTSGNSAEIDLSTAFKAISLVCGGEQEKELFEIFEEILRIHSAMVPLESQLRDLQGSMKSVNRHLMEIMNKFFPDGKA